MYMNVFLINIHQNERTVSGKIMLMFCVIQRVAPFFGRLKALSSRKETLLSPTVPLNKEFVR